MIFLAAVLFCAVTSGTASAVLAAALSFLAYNFFFIEPLYSFTVAEPYELLALIIFLAVAVVTATLAGRVKSQIRIAADRTRATRRLYEFTRRLSTLANVDEIAEGAVNEIYSSLGYPAIMLLDGDAGLHIAASWPPEDELDPASMSAAQWAFEHDQPAGRGTSTMPIIDWYFIALRSMSHSLGAVGIAIRKPRTMDSETQALFDTLAEQASASIERARLSESMVAAESAVEAERIRNTVLASISHDFRTPLASILGSSTTLLDYGEKLTPEARTDLLGHIKDEAEHLDGMVRNLLAMTRIDAGALELRKDWIDLNEIADRVVNAAKRHGAEQTFSVQRASPSPLVLGDAMLVEQALGNLIGNAIQHTPGDTSIVVATLNEADRALLIVEDNGPGISGDVLPRVFEKFVSARRRDELNSNKGEGTGLGLAIAKGIMQAHGGDIFALSPVGSGRGTRMTMVFPRDEAK
jgi:two-component system sensor histidine kinase KdpD